MESKLFISFFVRWFLIYNFVGLLKQSTAEFVLVNTNQGTVRGTKDFVTAYLQTSNRIIGKPFYKFLGIQYAQAPVGPLRFKPPQPSIPWSGVKDALQAGPACLQFGPTWSRTSEDCLYINVYTPQLPKNGEPLKPVMFWIHGGGFLLGDGIQIYGPDYLVSQDVLVVTINYRLHVFGFLSLENNKVSGNYGLKDQVQALKWVKENIANFGGDPNKVTIFGESAGAGSVQYHLISPLSKGLFHQAIVQSGSVLNSWAFTKTPKQNAIKLAQFMGYNITDENELYNFYMGQSNSALVEAYGDFHEKQQEKDKLTIFVSFVPSMEPESSEEPFITQSPTEILLGGNFTKVPMIIGTLNAEGIVLFPVATLTNNDFKILNNASDWAVPLKWEIQSLAERDRIGNEVKKYFFNGKTISWNTVNELVLVYSDLYFLMDIDKTITAFINHSEAPIYNYEMVFEPLRSPVKVLSTVKQFRFINFTGAGHGDDITMIFRPYVVEIIPFLYADQIVSQNMTKMWTNFAKTGNPNYSGLEVTWRKLEKDSRSYLEIGSKFTIRNGKVQQERIQFWENLCKTTSTNYTCVFSTFNSKYC